MKELINTESNGGDLIVNSREIASNFNKEHRNVLRDIDNLKSDSSKLSSDFFMEHEYTNKRGKTYKEYLLTRDGFSLLAMGFTGKEALEWKIKYIEAFNKMEKAIQDVYHISETAIVNNIMNNLEEKIFTNIDERLSKYEDNYRPTHANKINLNSYIKRGLGEFVESKEVDLVKDRILLVLDAEAWQDIPYEKLVNSMHLVDESIRAVKSFRNKQQLSIFEK